MALPEPSAAMARKTKKRSGTVHKKAPAASSRGRGVRRRLENDLQPKIQVESLARADARSSVEVADGVGDGAVARTGGAHSRSQIDAVEHVKHLRAELSSHSLRDRDVLEHREVHVGEARTINLVPAQVAAEDVRARARCRSTVNRRQAERRRVDPGYAREGGRLLEAMRHAGERITDDVISGANFIQRLPTMERQQTDDRPSM